VITLDGDLEMVPIKRNHRSDPPNRGNVAHR
jgi:hypothetical protein